MDFLDEEWDRVSDAGCEADVDTSSAGSGSVSSVSSAYSTDSTGRVRRMRTRKKKKKRVGVPLRCTRCELEELPGTVTRDASRFTAAQRRKKVGMRCKACAAARGGRRRTALAARIDEEPLWDEPSPQTMPKTMHSDAAPWAPGRPSTDVHALPLPKGVPLPVAWSPGGQILMIDVIDGFSTPSPYGTRIGGLPDVAAPRPLVSAWRIMTGECMYERGIFPLGGRAAEAAATISARIADSERPLRSIIVCGLGTSHAALDAFERSLFPVVSAFVAAGGRVAFPTTRGHALVHTGFFSRCWGAQWGAARRGSLTWVRAPNGARLGEGAEFGFACEAETLSDVPVGEVCYGVACGAGRGRAAGGERTWDAAVAIHQVGVMGGVVAYIGDVNAELAACHIVAAFCTDGPCL